MSTYWSLDSGLWPCVASIGLSHAIGYGLIYSPSVAATLTVSE